MPHEAKIKAAIWLSGGLLIFMTLADVMSTLAEPAIESTHSYYIDSNTGDDSKSGRSPSSAWRTIGKLNSIAVTPGDTVYFQRGQIWRETLEPRNGGCPDVRSPSLATAMGRRRSSVAAISSRDGDQSTHRFIARIVRSRTTFTSTEARAGV